MDEEWKEASFINISFNENKMPTALLSGQEETESWSGRGTGWIKPKEPFFFQDNHAVCIDNYGHKTCLYYIDKYFGSGQAALKIRHKQYHKRDAPFVEYIFPFHEITAIEIVKREDDVE